MLQGHRRSDACGVARGPEVHAMAVLNDRPAAMLIDTLVYLVHQANGF
jgi:hypothetical protein